VTKLGRESGSMTKAMAVFGLARMIFRIARGILEKFGQDGFLTHTINVLCLVAGNTSNWKFTVGCLCRTVAAGKIVNHKANNLVTRNSLDHCIDCWDDGDGVTIGASLSESWMILRMIDRYIHPLEGTNSSHLCSLGCQRGISDQLCC
jgi:hypothetical protein